MMDNPIPRRLAYEDGQDGVAILDDHEIAAIPDPVVILGDPGLGKTVLTQTLGSQPTLTRCGAGRFVRVANLRELMDEGDRIIIDGLDEIASAQPGGGVDAVLRALSQLNNPRFILSCREADWLGASAKSKIREDYQTEPVVLRLLPFEYADAEAFLANEFPELDSAELLDGLAGRGLDGIYQNPLTLRLLGEVVRSDGLLPQSRADLLERACRVMLHEVNPGHLEAAHAHRSDDELLLAAGAICAALLLCDRAGIFNGPPRLAPEDCLKLRDITDLPFAEAAGDALRTRLFQAEGEQRFTHIHRVVAEYLGAKWLARCVPDRCSERRMFSLFRPGDGVPTSLRGLHAWIGHFNGVLAYRCIEADPYAVFLYGDVETLGEEQARALLAALRRLSEDDPYFASDYWGGPRASGLIRRELQDDIYDIVTAPDRNLHLSMLILSAMVGTDLARDLAQLLCSIMFDPEHVLEERSCAAEALRASGSIDDAEAAIHRLLGLGDAKSARLAGELLNAIGASTVSSGTGVETVLAHLRITVNDISEAAGTVITDVRNDLFRDLHPLQLAELLDEFSSRAGPLYRCAGTPARSELADLIRRLTVQALEADFVVAPERLWAWICWVDGHDGHDRVPRSRFGEILHDDRRLRGAFFEHVLLTPCGENTWMAAHGLFDLGLGLSLSDEDVVVLLRSARTRAGSGPIDEETWRGLLQLGRTRDGISQIVREAAREASGGDPALLALLARLSDPVPEEWQIERERRAAVEEERRQETFRRHRDAVAERLAAVAAGDFRALTASAEAYLGRWSQLLDGSASPESRLDEMLGEELSEQVLAGFVAVLHRSDLPSAADIAQNHVNRRVYWVELTMICGIVELLRQGRPLDDIDRETLAAVYMASRRTPECDSEGPFEIGPALEHVLFADGRDVEVHFRASIEPQLAAGVEHVVELYRLTHDAELAPLAGRLAMDWLRTYPGLPSYVETELVSCAVESAANEMARHFDFAGRIENAPDHDAMQLWLSASFVVEFELRGEALRAAAADEPALVWQIRARLGEQYHEDFSRLSVAQLVYIVETFAGHWPVAPRPTRATRGYGHPWDASEFIKQTIYAIAGRPSAEATEALRHLVDGAAMTYADAARHALALQRKARRDFEYAAPSLDELRAVMSDGLPETNDGMRASLLDRLDTIQERLQASNTDPWEMYWREDRRPRPENYCRNRLVDQLRELMSPGIQIEPEAQMPGAKRADFVLSHRDVRLPIEIKGQWHDEVWDAASDQLDAYYAVEWRAAGQGLYIVLWFGHALGKQLSRHPEGLARPGTPQELRQMLIDRIPETRRSQIDVFVMDVTAPADTA